LWRKSVFEKQCFSKAALFVWLRRTGIGGRVRVLDDRIRRGRRERLPHHPHMVKVKNERARIMHE
jgi:uncharacterized protein (UPF0218 family)